MKIRIIFFSALIFCFNYTFAQTGINGNATVTGQTGVVTTTVPFLLISPDARAGGMADAGVAVTSDANSIYWNPSKLAFAPDDMAFSASYTPWLSELVPDISLTDISAYKKLDDKSGIGASFRYFSLGDITFTNAKNQNLNTFRPDEFAFDAGYARKLSEHFSIGLTGEFIYSDLSGGTTLSNGEVTRPAVDVAAGISAYYTKKINIGSKTADFAFGVNVDNIGPKITYTEAAHKDFIPTNLKVGGYLNFHIDENNEIGVALDLNKLLVPTPPIYEVNSKDSIVYNPDGSPKILNGKSSNVSVFQGMIQSFYDAPGGFKQEIALIDPSIAFEFLHAHKYAARIGFFYEDPNEGNRQYLTLGVGFKYKWLNLDLSYLVPTNGGTTTTRSPLENTFRFSLSASISKGKLVRN